MFTQENIYQVITLVMRVMKKLRLTHTCFHKGYSYVNCNNHSLAYSIRITYTGLDSTKCMLLHPPHVHTYNAMIDTKCTYIHTPHIHMYTHTHSVTQCYGMVLSG